MVEVQIRPVVATDIPKLKTIDHTCLSNHVWQMDIQRGPNQFGAIFYEIRLPRLISVSYPRPLDIDIDDWNRRMAWIMVAIYHGKLAGYVRVTNKILPSVAWITDIAVVPDLRCKGIGSTLVLAAQSWATENRGRWTTLEMSSKNYPAIRFAKKLGYEFCGYNDHYYVSQDVAIFFGNALY